MMLTTFEKGVAKGIEQGREQGIEQGREQGREQGQREMVQLFLEQKFGPLSAVVQARLAVWPAERLGEMIRAVYTAPSLQTLGLTDEK